MQYTSTASFRVICRLVLFCFTFATFHPAALGVPKTLDLKVRISDAGALTLDFRLWTLDLGPSSAYGQVQDPLLAPTPEFDLEDPFITQKADELGNDPTRIFAFMRDEIAYEAYQGSLRGARGTLWSKAGNALDQASLMIALLRASGIKARYVKGTLGTSEAQIVILSMFPPVLRIVGCPPADALKADPANDPKLLAEAKEHYWVEYGDSFTPADPTFPDAQIGQTFTAKQSDFTEVPDILRHKVTVRLKAERRVEAAIAFGGQSEVKNVLNETFITAALVGKPLSIGHFVNSQPAGGLVFNTITHTYSPYVLIGQNDSDISDDPIIRGTDYQEVITNFPLGNQLLIGLFLEMDVKSPDGKVETHERALVDRIGFAARQNGGTTTINLSGGAANQPAVSILDLVTINALPGLQAPSAVINQRDRLTPIQSELTAIRPLVSTIPLTKPLRTEQRELLAKMLDLTRQSTIINAETVVMAFAGASDRILSQLELGYLSEAQYISPRLILALTEGKGQEFKIKLDIRKNDVRVIPARGQVASIPFDFEVVRGILESVLEGEILSSVTGQAVVSFASIFANLTDPQDITALDAGTAQQLEPLAISDTAKARLAQALSLGKDVVTPTRMVTVNGEPTIAWLEIDRNTGHTISVMEDGGHQVFIHYVDDILGVLDLLFGILPSGPIDDVGTFIGKYLGFGLTNLNFIGHLLGELNNGQPFAEAARNAKTKTAEVMTTLARAGGLTDGGLLGGFKKGVGEGVDWINRNIP